MSTHLLVLAVIAMAALVGVVAIVVAVVAGGLAASGRRQVQLVGGGPLPRDPSVAYRRARRHAAVTALLSWGVAAVVAFPVGGLLARGHGVLDGAPGLGVALLPTTFGLTLLAIAAVGELTWPRPEGSVRSAALAPRRLGALTPRGLRLLTWAWAGTLTVVLLVTGLTAAAGGRTFRVQWASDGASSESGPYPGWPYAGPLIVAGLLVLAAAEIVLRLIARRPAVADTVTADDERLRRASARRVLAGAQLVLAGTLAGVLFTTGITLRSAASTTFGWATATQSVTTTLVAPGVRFAAVVAIVSGLSVALTGIAVTMVALAQAATEAGPVPTGAPASGPVPVAPARGGAAPRDQAALSPADGPAGDVP